MSNKYGIPEKDEEEIRARDKTCVYCHKAMKEYSGTKGTPADKATIEHLHNDGPFDEKSNSVICCGSCNSSRRNKELLAWFKTPYCIERSINKETVAESVKEYVRYTENFINRCAWTFAKTMPQMPHHYVVRDDLSYDDKKMFDAFGEYIKRNGYSASFASKRYDYLNTGGFKYWIIGNILNKAKISKKEKVLV